MLIAPSVRYTFVILAVLLRPQTSHNNNKNDPILDVKVGWMHPAGAICGFRLFHSGRPHYRVRLFHALYPGPVNEDP